MNPQQPMQDSGVTPLPEQPSVGSEPAAVVPQISPAEVVPQTQPPQVDSFSPAPVATPIQPEPIQSVPVPTDVQSNGSPIAAQPVVTPTVQPTAQPVSTPSAGLAPSSPGIPTPQPPIPPTTGQTTVGTGGLAMSSNPTPNDSSKKQKIIKFGVIGGAVVVLLVVVILGFTIWKNNQIALETYEGDGYSILVPSEYKESEEEELGVVFKEDDEEDTQSMVAVAVFPYGSSLTDEEFAKAQAEVSEDDIKGSLKEGSDASGGEYTNIEIKKTENDGQVIYSGTADYARDGKDVGKAYFQYFITKDEVSVVMINVDNSDPALAKNAQKIINSFEVE